MDASPQNHSGGGVPLDDLPLDILARRPLLSQDLPRPKTDKARARLRVVERPAPKQAPEVREDVKAVERPKEQPQASGRMRRPLARLAPGDDTPGFYLSLSDLMSLLLVFFVLIFSLSGMATAPQAQAPMEEPKITEAPAQAVDFKMPEVDPFKDPKPMPGPLNLGASLVAGEGSADPGLVAEPPLKEEPPIIPPERAPSGLVIDRALLTLVTTAKPVPAAALPREEASLAKLLKRVENEVRAGAGSGLEVERAPDKLILRLPEAITFDVGKAEIKPAMRRTLDRLAVILAGKDSYAVVVTGHTDDVPIHNQMFASNWELSGARAAAVGRALLTQGLDQSRLSIKGMADQSPRAPNNTSANRQLNRRVEIELRPTG